MWTYIRKHKKLYYGSALIISMIFLAVFSTLAVGMFTMSSKNVQMADNHHKANVAFANAESGLGVIRYWLSHILIPGTTSSADFLTTVISSLQSDLAANNISNIVVNGNGSIAPVTLGALSGHTFSGQIQAHPGNPAILQVSVTGNCGQITRTIQVNFDIEPDEYPIFDYGIATKGPLHFIGNPTIEGINYDNEADIYIESNNDAVALQVSGNTNFDGDINIGSATSSVDFDGDVLIGGDQGQTAIDNHVSIGAEPVEFPAPDAGHFSQYATGITIDSSTDTTDSMTLSNAVIKAGTNPSFAGNVIIQGVLFVESPNIVQFDGNVEIEGLIVADGDVDNPGTDSMIFNGNFQSGTFPEGAEFDAIRSETGSSLIMPGFAVELAGNFSSLSGVIAVSGFHLSGNADATITGSIINYSDSPTVIEGNATLRFDRSGATEIPAGFEIDLILHYDSASYSEIVM